jgi:hypothetical protein
MNEKQIKNAIAQGWPKPKYEVGNKVEHWSRPGAVNTVTEVNVDEKWLGDYNVKAWSYSLVDEAGGMWWGRDDDLERVYWS